MASFIPHDFTAVSEMITSLSHSCSTLPEDSEFQILKISLDEISCLLTHLSLQASDSKSLLMTRCNDRRKEWLHILETLVDVVCQLQELVNMYQIIGEDGWKEAEDGHELLGNLRSEITVHLDGIETFVDSLGLSPLARKDPELGEIERLLVERAREERLGLKKKVVLGTGLRRVEKILQDGGVERSVLERHDARIKQLLIWVEKNEPALTALSYRGLGELDELDLQRNGLPLEDDYGFEDKKADRDAHDEDSYYAGQRDRSRKDTADVDGFLSTWKKEAEADPEEPEELIYGYPRLGSSNRIPDGKTTEPSVWRAPNQIPIRGTESTSKKIDNKLPVSHEQQFRPPLAAGEPESSSKSSSMSKKSQKQQQVPKHIDNEDDFEDLIDFSEPTANAQEAATEAPGSSKKAEHTKEHNKMDEDDDSDGWSLVSAS